MLKTLFIDAYNLFSFELYKHVCVVIHLTRAVFV